MQNQTTDFIINFLSPYLCSYRKGYNTHQALLPPIEKWKNNLDDKSFEEAVLMELSKAFDILKS